MLLYIGLWFSKFSGFPINQPSCSSYIEDFFNGLAKNIDVVLKLETTPNLGGAAFLTDIFKTHRFGI